MILMKDIIREGHKTLTTVAKEVQLPLSPADKKTLKDMLFFVINSQDEEIAKTYELRPAVGLAAPQINISKRMFAMHVSDFDQTLYSFAFVNPKIIKKSQEITYIPGGEGCLSVDRATEGLTPRYSEITIESYVYDIASDEVVHITMDLSGYPSVVFQHEYDHLDGIMFTTKLFPQIPNARPLFEIDEELEDN